MNKQNNHHQQQLDQQIHSLFAKKMSTVTLDDNLRNKLLAQQEDVAPLSPWQQLMETEVSISLSSFTAATAAMVLVVGLLLQTLFLPGEVPEPKYKIVEMQAAQVDIDLSETL